MQYTMVTKLLVILLLIEVLSGCKKITDLEPVTETEGKKLFTDDQMATSAVVGLYAQFMSSISMYNGSITRCLSQSADDLKRVGNNENDNLFYTLGLSPNHEIVDQFWNASYFSVYHCNSILELLQHSTELTAEVKVQLKGEALFIRAFIYFYLVNLFGDVPLVLVTDPEINRRLSRTSRHLVYRQIAEDLREAQALLPMDYPANSVTLNARIRANKAAAVALLARTYLYMGDYINAETMSSWVINCGVYSLEKDLDHVFLSTSNETIFSLYPTLKGYNSAEGRLLGINPQTGRAPFEITSDLLKSFQSTDQRPVKWMKPFVSNNKPAKAVAKYKVFESESVTEYNVVLRLAEMYLIRAEALAAMGRSEAAIEDINVVRKRSNDTELSLSLPKNEIEAAIETENRHEFFVEFGHRWFDLKRWKSNNILTPDKSRADDILEIIKPLYWKSYKGLFPIPGSEIQKSEFLYQNPGY